MKNAQFACLLLLALVSTIMAGDITINPGSEATLSNNSATGGAAGDNGNVSFDLNSNFSTSAKTIKAESSGGLSVGKGVATSQIFYEFDVGASRKTVGNTIGAWVSYSVNWQGYQVILNTLGTNASVVVELALRDMTDGENLSVETIHALDLKTYSFGQLDVGFDFNDSRTKVGTFAAVLKRGHTYRLTLRMSATLFVLVQSGVPSTCDYMDGFEGGGNGRVQLNSLHVKAALDDKEVLGQFTRIENQLNLIEDQLTHIEDQITLIENQFTHIEDRFTRLENHRHTYLTGSDASHNNTEASSSLPLLPEPILAPRRPAGDGGRTLEPEAGAASKPMPRLYRPLVNRHPDEHRRQ